MSTTDDPIQKPSGDDTSRGASSLDDLVDEASLESFPCSDPPSFTSLRVGMPVAPTASILPRRDGAQRDEPRAEPAEAVRRPRVHALAGTQGIFFLATGLWPILHLRSFEAVTGRKRDRWLVRTVGLLVSCVGGALLASARSRRVTKEIALVGASTSAALAAIDVVYTAKRTIPKVYLLDAVVELGLVAAWGLLYPRRNSDGATGREKEEKAG